MQTVLKQIITKFNNEFNKQNFIDWFNETKEDFLSEEKEQIESAFNAGMNCSDDFFAPCSDFSLPESESSEYFLQTFNNN